MVLLKDFFEIINFEKISEEKLPIIEKYLQKNHPSGKSKQLVARMALSSV